MFKVINLKGLAFQILIILLAIEVLAMKPYRPEVMKFEAPELGLELQLPIEGDPKLIKKEGVFLWKKTETTQWKDFEGEKHPARVLFFPEIEKIVFLGGLGDPGVDLGQISITDFSGKILKVLNAKDSITNLEDMVREFRRKPNFPWMTGLLIKEKNTLVVDICNQERIELNVEKMSLVKSTYQKGETQLNIGGMTYDE